MITDHPGECNGDLSYPGAAQGTSHISHNTHTRSVVQVRIPNYTKTPQNYTSLSLKATPFRSKVHLDPLSARRFRQLEATYKEVQIVSQGKSRSLYTKFFQSLCHCSNMVLEKGREGSNNVTTTPHHCFQIKGRFVKFIM